MSDQNKETAPIGNLNVGTDGVLGMDRITSSIPVWSNKQVVQIGLNDPQTNILRSFEYEPEAMLVDGKATKFSILRCTDNGALVGKPFADSYGLLNNAGLMGVVEQIAATLDKLGLKWSIVTTGTLRDRERSYISLQIDQDSTYKVGNREFQAFLNCLNSIPSSGQCNVTFANNTFCVCCKNTFHNALHNKDGGKFHAAIRHSKGMKAALQDVPLLVEAYFDSNTALFAKLKAFEAFSVTLPMAESVFSAFLGGITFNPKGEIVIPDNAELSTRGANVAETLKGLFVKGRGNKGETALDLFSAVTEFYTHLSAGETKDTMKQVESSEAGSAAQYKQEFFETLVAATNATDKWTGICKVGDTLLVAYNAKDRTPKTRGPNAATKAKEALAKENEALKAKLAEIEARANVAPASKGKGKK